jgi:signal transduction histidine kinase/CheY-like chemotaxis protein
LTNVTILDRPTSTRTLVSSVQAAIRGRRRQYQLRDQLTALREAQEALRSADRRKDEFLAMLGHELRNPLAPIRTASEVLARTLPSQGPTQSAVSIVRRQVSHLTRMVDDLLDVSRITQGRIELQRESVEVNSIVAQALEGVEPLIVEKRHNVNVKAHPVPLYVDGDCVRLVQSVTNLLTNSIKYTDDGGNLHVETYTADSMAVISIRDDGVGITADLMPRIFSLFVQSARSLDRAAGGLGIGLSVVERIVEMHGGSVTAFSAGAGLGSTFRISLPRIEPPEGEGAESTPLARSVRRILVVDDNVDAATSLAELLKLDGHLVEAVYSAKAALATVGPFQPDLILLDIGLPDMNGYQVARRIRDLGLTVRIVALSGYGQTEDIRKSQSAGFDAHLVKPVTMDLLERVVAGMAVGEDGIV